MESIYDYLIKNENLINKNQEEALDNGITIYEVIRIEKGVPLFFEDHFERLINSFKLASQNLWLSEDSIRKDINTLIKKNNIANGNVKLVFNINDGKYQAYFIEHHYPSLNQYKNGVETILYNKERKNRNAKIVDKNLREEINKELVKRGVYEAILVDNKGNITEGSRSNIFLVKANKLYSSPIEDVLPGITRKYIINCCENLGISYIEKSIKASELYDFEGLFISGTSPKVLPISKVDQLKFFSPNNEIILKIKEEYDKIVYNYIKNNIDII